MLWMKCNLSTRRSWASTTLTNSSTTISSNIGLLQKMFGNNHTQPRQLVLQFQRDLQPKKVVLQQFFSTASSKSLRETPCYFMVTSGSTMIRGMSTSTITNTYRRVDVSTSKLLVRTASTSQTATTTAAAAAVATIDELLQKGDEYLYNMHDSLDVAQSVYEGALQLQKQYMASVDPNNNNNNTNTDDAALEFTYCQILYKLGTVHARKGSYEEATNYFQQSLVLLETKHDMEKEDEDVEILNAFIWNGLGAVYASQQQLKEAFFYFEKSAITLRHYYNQNHHHDEIPLRLQSVCENLGQLYSSIQYFSEARTYLEEALRVSQQHEKKLQQPHLYIKLGDCYIELNEYILAKDMYEQALVILVQQQQQQKEENTTTDAGDNGEETKLLQTMKAYLKHHIGCACAQLGLYEEGMTHLKESLVFHGTSNSLAQAVTYNVMGAISAKQKNKMDAFTYFHKALTIYEQQHNDDDANILQVKRNIALLEQQQQEEETAEATTKVT
jgi:tetratricopeptide (TPR) repeat protein